MNINSKKLQVVAIITMLLGSAITTNIAQAKDTNSGPSVPASESLTPTEEAPAKLPSSGRTESSAKNCFSSIRSKPMPLPGQTQRSSQNFSLKGVKKFQIKVYQGGKLNTSIRFNVKLDRRLQVDPIVGSNIGTGTYTNNGETYPLYIASPQGAGQSSFNVKFCKVN
jgi:hypothetical protein